MRIDHLASPGELVNGHRLRTEACRAICAAEIYLSPERRKELAAFFLDCAKHADPKPTKKVSE